MTIKEAIEANCKDGGWFYQESDSSLHDEYKIDGDGLVLCRRNGRLLVHGWDLQLTPDELTATNWTNNKEMS